MWSSTDRTLHQSIAGRFLQKVQGSSRSGANGRRRRQRRLGDWHDEKAACGWYEGAAVDPATDPARCQDAIGGSFGGGNPSTCMLETALVPGVGNVIKGKMMDTCDKGWREGKKEEVKTARERTQGPS